MASAFRLRSRCPAKVSHAVSMRRTFHQCQQATLWRISLPLYWSYLPVPVRMALLKVSLLQEPPVSKTSSHNSTADTEVNMSFQVGNQDPERPDNGDSDSIRNDSDGTVISESEMVDPREDKPLPGGSVKEDYCYVSEKIQNLQKKRKRGHDSSIIAYKKPVQGGESDAAAHLLPGPKDTKEMANHSPAFRHEEHKET